MIYNCFEMEKERKEGVINDIQVKNLLLAVSFHPVICIDRPKFEHTHTHHKKVNCHCFFFLFFLLNEIIYFQSIICIFLPLTLSRKPVSRTTRQETGGTFLYYQSWNISIKHFSLVSDRLRAKSDWAWGFKSFALLTLQVGKRGAQLYIEWERQSRRDNENRRLN